MAHLIIKLQAVFYSIAWFLLVIPGYYLYYALGVNEKIIPITVPLMAPNIYATELTEQIIATILSVVAVFGLYSIEMLCLICCFNVCQYIDWHFHQINELDKMISKNPNHFNKKTISKQIKKIIRGSQNMYA